MAFSSAVNLMIVCHHATNELNHASDTVTIEIRKCFMSSLKETIASNYSGTPLKWTPSGPKILSAVARCP